MSETYHGRWRWRFLERLWVRRLVIVLTALPAAVVCALCDAWVGQPEFWSNLAESWERHPEDL